MRLAGSTRCGRGRDGRTTVTEASCTVADECSRIRRQPSILLSDGRKPVNSPKHRLESVEDLIFHSLLYHVTVCYISFPIHYRNSLEFEQYSFDDCPGHIETLQLRAGSPLEFASAGRAICRTGTVAPDPSPPVAIAPAPPPPETLGGGGEPRLELRAGSRRTDGSSLK